MAMTINDDIVILECIYKDYKNYRVGDRCYRIRAALEHTIKNLHKYQKIQEMVKSWEGDSWTDGISEDCIEKISEVMEDGKA